MRIKILIFFLLSLIFYIQPALSVPLLSSSYSTQYGSGFPTAFDACNDAFINHNPSPADYLFVVPMDNSSTQCFLRNSSGGNTGWIGVTAQAGACPSNSALDGLGACSCNSGYVANATDTACVLACPTGPGAATNSTVDYSSISPLASACGSDSCMYTVLYSAPLVSGGWASLLGDGIGASCGAGAVPTTPSLAPPAPPVCQPPQILNALGTGCIYPTNPACPAGQTDIGSPGYPFCVVLGLPPSSTSATDTTTAETSTTITTPDGLGGSTATTISTAITNGTTTTLLTNVASESTLVSIGQSLKDFLGFGAGANFGNPASEIAIHQNNMSNDLAGIRQGVIDAHDSDEAMLSGSFVFDPVYVACTPYTGFVLGRTVTIDICEYINKIRDLIGWLLALFGAYAIYQTIFKARV